MTYNFWHPNASGGYYQSRQNWNANPRRVYRAPKGTPLTRVLWSLLITIVFGCIYFYIAIPAINFQTTAFYWFIFLLCAVFSISMLLMQRFRANSTKEFFSYTKKNLAVPFWIVIILLAVMIVGYIIGWPIFRAKDYSQLLPVTTGDFAEDVAEIDFNQIPMLDSDSSNNLANRKLGELSDLVSQFTVSDSSSQINYKGNPVRVNYLNYSGFFKWWNNKKNGIPAYMLVDMRTQEVTVVRLSEGIRYSPSEYFNHDLDRYLRFHYPTKLFDDINFEIDENGTPYWVASVMKRRVGLFNGTDIVGAVLVNAVTGECQYYDKEDVPTWVDRVFLADLLINQYDYYGTYHNGFWNSIFGQTDCTTATQGYNYIAQNDDVYMYTGITSVTGDRGNIGFILVNQRTKEARYYSCAGAEEFSAMSSAEGAVQQYKYTATFPLLLNISNQPTYFMALKDTAGLVKMYAMVNVQQYQIVAIGNTLQQCQENYHQQMISNGIIDTSDIDQSSQISTDTITGKITEIRSADVEGTTQYYIKLEGQDTYFSISASACPEAVLLNVGDSITVTYEKNEGYIQYASEIITPYSAAG